jgi:lysophospholipase L1-like esterase
MRRADSRIGVISPRAIRHIAAFALILTAGCGKDSPPDTGPTSTPPTITCPADVTVAGVSNAAQNVTYPAPTVADGQPPVATTCAPVSGASFPLGTTTVNCAANDALARQAACSFKVTLKGVAIAATRYSAIGDSFTEGQNGQPPRFVDTPNAYPTKLQLALDTAYPGQGIVVLNHGEPGSGQRIAVIDENVKTFVRADRPDVVLLEGGYNDLLGDCGNGPTNTPPCQDAIGRVPVGYRDCIRHAREASSTVKYVFAATLTPPGPHVPPSNDRRISNTAITQTNVGIRQTIAREGAVLVDLYPLFVGHEAEYVDTDGLHLRPAGYQVMADAFFAAIQKTIPQTPLFGFSAPR